MRQSVLWGILLLQGLSVTCADPDADARDGASSGEHVRPDDVLLPDQAAGGREKGLDLVEAALAKLATIPAQPHHKRRKQSSLLSKAFHFLLRAAPSLSMRGPPTSPPGHHSHSHNNHPNQHHQQHHPPDRAAIPAALQEAVGLLEESVQFDNADGLYLLAEMNFYGNYSQPRNFSAAFDYYRRLADTHGNSSALYMVGLMYSTGIGEAVERDQARALLYYTFAALKGHTRAEMTVGARHHAGIGTPRSCDEALTYYKRVADKAMAWYRSGPPGGMAWVSQPYRIADEAGGVYGEGASAVSSGMLALRAQPHSDAYASIDDIIEYLDLMAQKGDFKAALNVGRIYYEGQRTLERDVQTARRYFYLVASKFWRKDGWLEENPKPGLDKTAAKAAGFLGRIYLRGDGDTTGSGGSSGGSGNNNNNNIEPNFDRARLWLERGAAYGDAQSQYLLGLMLLQGLGGTINVAKATELLRAAADNEYTPAQVELGVLYLDQGQQPEDLRIANELFEQAARYGNMQAYYYLAEMTHHGVGRDRACAPALAYYKSVAEKADPLVSSWTEANQAYSDGNYELALLEYLGAAEQGYEMAQNNVAFLLDPQQSSLVVSFLPSVLPASLLSWLSSAASALPSLTATSSSLLSAAAHSLFANPTLSLIHYTRSSRQHNVDALVKMGDYYLYGIGTEKNVDKAVQCYTGASEYRQSAQALYNLGWMHENGVGLNQDYHLAKRYYDIALETNEEAYLPVTLTLLKLRLRSAWNTLTHGQINSIQDEPARKWSLKEWVESFTRSAAYHDNGFYNEYADDEYLDGGGYDGDGVEVVGLDDLSDMALLEPFLVIGLVIAITFLMYYRQQRQLAHRRNEEEQQQQQQQQQNQQPQPPQPQPQGFGQGFQMPADGGGGGLFPPAGDPAQADWLAGGIGH